MGAILEGCSPHLELETARCGGTEISMVPTWLAPARCIKVFPIRHPLRRLCLKKASGHQSYEMKVEIIIAAILIVLCDGALAQTDCTPGLAAGNAHCDQTQLVNPHDPGNITEPSPIPQVI